MADSNQGASVLCINDVAFHTYFFLFQCLFGIIPFPGYIKKSIFVKENILFLDIFIYT